MWYYCQEYHCWIRSNDNQIRSLIDSDMAPELIEWIEQNKEIGRISPLYSEVQQARKQYTNGTIPNVSLEVRFAALADIFQSSGDQSLYKSLWAANVEK